MQGLIEEEKEMIEYPKIQSVFNRDLTARNKKFLVGDFARPEFELLKDCEWIWTEKIDGTNIRIGWDGTEVTICGRTNEAQIHTSLYKKLQDLFKSEKMLNVFGDKGGLTLFGEGFGAKIQKNGQCYIGNDVDFILFDIVGGDMFFTFDNVIDFAKMLNIHVVPIIGKGTIVDAIDYTSGGFSSVVAQNPLTAEGLVLRLQHDLFDRKGNRIITKMKYRDFHE